MNTMADDSGKIQLCTSPVQTISAPNGGVNDVLARGVFRTFRAAFELVSRERLELHFAAHVRPKRYRNSRNLEPKERFWKLY